MTLTQLYDEAKAQPTAPQLILRRIAKATLKTERAAIGWIKGERKPDSLTRRAIAKEFGIPESELWPEHAKKRRR